MAQWYCYAGGRQYGPIAEEVLKQWIYDRRVKPSDLVWTDGMANWAPASSVPTLSAASPGPAPPPIVHVPMVDAHPPGGTGGATPNGQLTAQARQALRGRWGLAIGFCLLMWLLTNALTLPGNVLSTYVQFKQARSAPRQPHDAFRPYRPSRERSSLEEFVDGLSTIGSIAALVLTGPLTLGSAIFFLSLTRGGTARIGMLFSGFRNFGNALAAYLLMVIFIFLWMLLLIIPGIIAGLAYSQTFYLLADDKSLGPLEAIRRSKQMMRGYKWKLFCLGVRFIGWSLLCLLTCGIGYLWLAPYMATAFALFYDDLRQPRAAVAPAPDGVLQGALSPSV